MANYRGMPAAQVRAILIGKHCSVAKNKRQALCVEHEKIAKRRRSKRKPAARRKRKR